jgi:hypothetical protein
MACSQVAPAAIAGTAGASGGVSSRSSALPNTLSSDSQKWAVDAGASNRPWFWIASQAWSACPGCTVEARRSVVGTRSGIRT